MNVAVTEWWDVGDVTSADTRAWEQYDLDGKVWCKHEADKTNEPNDQRS